MKSMYKGLNIIGSDETGVGDYFTPLIAVAAFVPHQNINKLTKMGVVDSKKLSSHKIMEISKKITPLIKYRKKHLTQSGYNKLTNDFNANELKMFLHLGAINDLEKSIKDVDLIIIDKFSTTKTIYAYYQKLVNSSFDFQPIKAKTKLIEKGESEHVAVACASIIARAELINMMGKQNTKWRTKFPLGTNKIVEKFAIDFVDKHGMESLDKVAKISFKTTKKLFG